MKNILTAAQTRDADQHSIQHEPIASIDLMERASQAFVTHFIQLVPDKTSRILVCCGTGNNGGDGLAIARLLQQRCYDSIEVWIARYTDKESADFSRNLSRLPHMPVTELYPNHELPEITAPVVIDALLGSGLNRPLTTNWQLLANHINRAKKNVIAVDIPTGLPAEGPFSAEDTIIYAEDVVTFQRPKLSFFFPESANAVGKFHVVSIGLDEKYIQEMPCDFKLIDIHAICKLYRKRKAFSHKGTYGHALLIAGDESTMGAAILSSGASLYSGTGLTTACIPNSGLTALNAAYPEIMYTPWEDVKKNWQKFNAIGVGPGLGKMRIVLTQLLEYDAKPLVLDADALTLLAENRLLLDNLPAHTVLTPHMKEFDRLFGEHPNWWERVQTARKKAKELQIVIILKNQYSFITLPDGMVLINPSGNPAMASGGMGDVLTGMVTSFLAQGYTAEEAAVLGCYIHGAAGDALAARGMAVIPARVLLQKIPEIIGNL